MKKSRFTDRTKWKIIIVLMVGMVVVALFLQAGILMYVNSKIWTRRHRCCWISRSALLRKIRRMR